MPDQRGEHWVEHDGDQPAGKAVVIEVHSLQGEPRMKDHRGVDKSRQYPIGPSKVSGKGGQCSTEQPRQLEGGGRTRHMIEQTAQEHPCHNGHDVPGMLSIGREAHNGQDTSQGRPVQIPADEHDIPGSQQSVHTHAHQHRPNPIYPQVVTGSASRGGQQMAVGAQPISPALPPSRQDQQNTDGGQRPANGYVVPGGPEMGGSRLQTERL